MATINWAGSTNPVATLRFRSNATTDVEWSGPLIWNAQAGDTIRIRLRFRSTDTMGVHRMRAWVERLDLKGAVVDELRKFEFARDGEYDIIESVDIPLDGQLLRFRVRAQVALSWRLDTGSGQGGPVWADEERRVYTAFVQFYGDFALDYVPITILYCPPGQDMTNAITQSTEYGTVVTLGTTELVGSGAESTSYVRGGVRISTPYVQEGWSHEDGEKTSTSQSVENASRNSVAFGYEWSSTLLADNQRAIGRAYWGPLGDIFVLLRNPWFSLIGNEKGISLVVNADRTAEETELLILPAHKLLRPGDDPVASRISRATRRRLLALDPFITNVDEFLPPSEAQDENINIPLANAAIPYADPSAPAPGGHGLNRAALLARYAISTGIEVDLSSTTNIVVEDQQTNESVYYAERSEVSGLDGTIDLAGFFQQGVGGTAVERTFTRISYQASHETRLRHVNTARCTLIRNQNEADLRDIEVWWDKQFSTFMFRTIEPMAGLVIGVVTDWFHQREARFDRRGTGREAGTSAHRPPSVRHEPLLHDDGSPRAVLVPERPQAGDIRATLREVHPSHQARRGRDPEPPARQGRVQGGAAPA